MMAMTIPVLFRNHFQMGYVVRNMDKAIENLQKKFGVAGWRILDIPEGEPVKRLGFSYVQNSMIELVEMRPGQEIFFKPWIPESETAIRLNHLGYMMNSEEEWDTVSQQFEAAGYQIAVAKSLGDVRFQYYDTVADLGHYCEITYLGPTAKNFFDAPHN
jgi:hypothetical protein